MQSLAVPVATVKAIFRAGPASERWRLALQQPLCERSGMIQFRPLPDDHPDLSHSHSPLLRAAMLTLSYAQENGGIGLTQTKAFKRVFVHWAIANFDWPGSGPEEMFQVSKVINEYEFPPLEVLHYLLIKLRLGRHYKGIFQATKRGVDLAQAPGLLFADLIPFFLFYLDHSSYARFGVAVHAWLVSHVWRHIIQRRVQLCEPLLNGGKKFGSGRGDGHQVVSGPTGFVICVAVEKPKMDRRGPRDRTGPGANPSRS